MERTDRRAFLAGTAALATAAVGGCTQPVKTVGRLSNMPKFVTRNGATLQRGGSPYQFVGANIWYGAYLGADASYGNRPRLVRELDRLQKLGVTNLRILASAEEGRLKNSIKPGFRTSENLNEALFVGLDFCMAELAKRGMTAVLYLTNFWEWSGGIMIYLDYATGRFIDMGDPAHPWPAFADRNADFYRNRKAMDMYHAYVQQLVGRTNSVTGVAYRNDPAIMAWQLCNEPRPGGSDAVISKSLPNYYAWIESTAKLIRSIDSNHLVSLGHEGTIAANGREDVFIDAHQHMDYVTAHIWPLNWGWVDGKDLPGTWTAGSRKIQDYLETHVRLAVQIGKPLVIEEFGFPRDGESHDPAATTEYRARYYKMIYNVTEASLATGGPVVGTNFWTWNGEARANHKDYRFKDGDLQYMGDPPHEPQGWYGNFDSDTAMLSLISEHAARIAAR